MKASVFDSAKVIAACVLVGSFLAQPANAALCKISATSMANYTQYPLFENPVVSPVSLLVLSIDHQLFNKAYTDYTNLDADAAIETTYDGEVKYSGYFGTEVCYKYVTNKFEAFALTTNRKCTSAWSGNFLNWASMTRLDVLRWTLYGGNRSTDSATETVLERAHIPQDGHSFVKVFAGNATATVADVTPYTSTVSFCNTTSTNEASATTLVAPVIQVALGAWPGWTLLERYQCDRDTRGFNSKGAPLVIDKELVARVKVCDPAIKEDFCTEYKNGTISSFKPTGLLQQYGEGNNPIEFGLMSGSYDKPRSGGVLRSKIGKITDEINQSNGTFILQGNGDAGIINTIRRIRMSQYSRDVWRDCSTFQITNNLLNDARASDRKCAMWGNPIAEIYAEAVRYLSGTKVPTPGFDADDTASGVSGPYIVGMPKESTWDDPLENRPICTKCNIVVLSTGLNSFDRDELPAVPVVGAIGTAVDQVGANESIIAGTTKVLSGGMLASGSADAVTSTGASFRDCSAKTSLGLSKHTGICPEVASLQGGYDIAGIAFKAYTNDFRPETARPGRQFITTYTVALGESLPKLDFPVGGKIISVLPFAQATGGTVFIPSAANPSPPPAYIPPNFLSSSIVNFSIGFLTGPIATADAANCQTNPNTTICNYFGVRTGNTATEGSYIINWEDSTWGNDYDQDIVQVLSYCIGTACNSLDFCRNTDTTSSAAPVPLASRACGATPSFDPNKLYLRSEIVSTASGVKFRAGWITAGSDEPGTAAPFLRTGANCNFLVTAPGDFRCGNAWTVPQVRAYSAGTGAESRLLENPLFYAAKYGGFNDADTLVPPAAKNGLPNTNFTNVLDNQEWDRVNLNGDSTPDGIPDNYFPVRNPAQLKEQLGRAFASIAASASSGTSAAVVSSTGEGSGAVFQATYARESQRENDTSNVIRWSGSVRGLWVTPEGKFAEDTNSDPAFLVEPKYDDGSDLPITFVQRIVDNKIVTKAVRNGVDINLDEIVPIWDAAVQLSRPTDTNLATNRNYSSATLAQEKRYIFTWTDNNEDGLVDQANEQVDFTSSVMTTPANTPLINACAIPDTQSLINQEHTRLVNWIRGIDQPALPAVINLNPLLSIPAVPALRSRRFNVDGDGTLTAAGTVETHRLGDIVNSSPLVVAKPASAFDFLYRDGTYTRFVNEYRCRRSVVYAGANDGMLHAFNAGFRTPEGFNLSPPAGCSPASAKQHSLGSELWGYIPGNLLPHLQWLADPDYTHVFYVDGNPQSFDVKAFPDTGAGGRHPGGWGTILVVPFRLGGGDISVANATVPGGTSRSAPAYIIMDITDPESPPKLIAEIVLPVDVGAGQKISYSFASPALAFDIGTGNAFSYKLIFGTGPTDILPEVHSKQKASIFTYELKLNAGLTTVTPSLDYKNFGIANSLVSDISSADFDFGGTTDAAYFGTIEGLPSTAAVGPNDAMEGRLYKMPFESTSSTPGLSGNAQPGLEFQFDAPIVYYTPSPLMPIQGKPGLTLTNRRLPGVLFGTGRMLSQGDFKSQRDTEGALYILDDPKSFETTVFSGPVLTNTNDFRTQNGPLGFKRLLQKGERGFTSPAVFRGIGIFTTFVPGLADCENTGTGRLFQFNFANDASSALFGSAGESVTQLGSGSPSNPRIFVSPPPTPRFDSNGVLIPPPPSGVTIITQDSSGALNTTSSIANDFDSFGEQAWWEPREAN